MNHERACHLLELDAAVGAGAANPTQLKKQYHKMALRWHPDKCGGSAAAAARFQEIRAAYDFLEGGGGCGGGAAVPVEKMDIFDMVRIVEELCQNIKLEEPIRGREWMFYIAKIVTGVVRSRISTKIAHQAQKIVKWWRAPAAAAAQKHKQSAPKSSMAAAAPAEFIILNPTLENLFDGNLYKLRAGEETFLVPLWHYELVFMGAAPPRTVVVQCIPDLPADVSIDSENNIIVDLSVSVTELWESDEFRFMVGGREFSVNCDELKLRRTQRVVLHGCGIPRAVEDDIYNVSVRGDIMIYMLLLLP